MSNETTIRNSLAGLADPELGRTLGDLRMLKEISVAGDRCTVVVNLPTPAYPDRERITTAITQQLASVAPQLKQVTVNYVSTVQGKNSGGKIGMKVKNVIAVGSGKGGVGKSTMAACLAYGLKHYGASVGLMDADVYGPSLPHMLGAKGQPQATQYNTPDGQQVIRIQPIEVDGIKMISMGFFVEPEKAVVWRGPMLHKYLTQFLKDTEWGDLDYLIIDLPPGTGDVSLTLAQLLGLAGAVVVCTPQQVALLDAVKAINMYQQLNVPVLGVIENMSGEIFGRGGAKAKAEQMGIPFLGEVPIEAIVRIRGDEGRVGALFSEDNPSREPLLRVTEQVAIQIARTLLEQPSLPNLEIL